MSKDKEIMVENNAYFVKDNSLSKELGINLDGIPELNPAEHYTPKLGIWDPTLNDSNTADARGKELGLRIVGSNSFEIEDSEEITLTLAMKEEYLLEQIITEGIFEFQDLASPGELAEIKFKKINPNKIKICPKFAKSVSLIKGKIFCALNLDGSAIWISIEPQVTFKKKETESTATTPIPEEPGSVPVSEEVAEEVSKTEEDTEKELDEIKGKIFGEHYSPSSDIPEWTNEKVAKLLTDLIKKLKDHYNEINTFQPELGGRLLEYIRSLIQLEKHFDEINSKEQRDEALKQFRKHHKNVGVLKDLFKELKKEITDWKNLITIEDSEEEETSDISKTRRRKSKKVRGATWSDHRY